MGSVGIVMRISSPVPQGVAHLGTWEWDISELAEEQVLQLNAALERRVAERTRTIETSLRDIEAFNATVSHDLRAPLSVIRLSCAVISQGKDDDLPPRVVESLARIRRLVSHMTELVDDLLALAHALSRRPVFTPGSRRFVRTPRCRRWRPLKRDDDADPDRAPSDAIGAAVRRRVALTDAWCARFDAAAGLISCSRMISRLHNGSDRRQSR
jgi:signal transduction histidine kinase